MDAGDNLRMVESIHICKMADYFGVHFVLYCSHEPDVNVIIYSDARWDNADANMATVRRATFEM